MKLRAFITEAHAPDDDSDIITMRLRAKASEVPRSLWRPILNKEPVEVSAFEPVDVPIVDDFWAGVKREAEYQRQKWSSTSDAGKTHADWFWLLGYLGGKALYSILAGNKEKALHHTISTAAACANWHAAITGEHTGMRPGIEPPQ